MTYWFLFTIALVCLLIAIALFYFTDAFGTDRALFNLVTMSVSTVCFLATLGTGAGFVVANIHRTSCIQQGTKTGIHVQYELLSGCYVQVEDHLVPYDRWVQVSGVNTR